MKKKETLLCIERKMIVKYAHVILIPTTHFSSLLFFRQVVIIFHSQISEAFSRFDISTPQAQNRYLLFWSYTV